MDEHSVIQELRARIATLEGERAQLKMLLAAILYQYGEARITPETRLEVLRAPVILVTEDRASGDLVLSLGDEE